MGSEVSEKLEAYCAAWQGALTLLLSRLTGGQWRVEEDATASGECKFAVRVNAAALPGRQWLALSAAHTAKLLQLFLGEEVTIPGELDDMQREALEELTRQWCGLAATALKADYGELSFEVAHDSTPGGGAPPSRGWSVTDGTQSIAVTLYFDSELETFLRQTAPAVEKVASPGTSPSAIRVDEFLRDGNLQLLMDVELPVVLRFGTRQATLREVLDLATGAVLELDREVEQPVDLMLNNKLIARGEVVVVDGNYGLRVTEVASPQQRVGSI